MEVGSNKSSYRDEKSSLEAEMILQSGSSGRIAVVVAIIGAAAVIIGAVIQSSGGSGGGDDGSDSGGRRSPVGPKEAEITVSIRASPFQVQGGADAKIFIDDDVIGTIFTYQEPYALRTTEFAEGEHTYDLEVTAYDTAGNVAWIKRGSDTITVQDGDNYAVLYDSSTDTVYLSPT